MTPARVRTAMVRRGAHGVVVVLFALLAGACVGVPDTGEVHQFGVSDGGGPAGDVAAIDPEPPRRGATPSEIVSGFLDALQASPVSTTVARLYLTAEASDAWAPQDAIITYTDRAQVLGGPGVRIRLSGTQSYDRVGRWQGPLDDADSTLAFRVVPVDGQWRITDPPDALVVSRSWFAPRYTTADLYFLDPAGTSLVPEPVVVPVGETSASTLVRGLLAGPRPGLSSVERSEFPAGLRLALSVPVDSSGLAQVNLQGQMPPLSGAQLGRLFAQLGWTMRQDRRVRSVALTIDGQPVTLPGGATEVDVSSGASYDTGLDANGTLYGLQDGRVVAGQAGDLTPLDGPFGVRPRDWAAVAVDLGGTTVAAVSASRDRLVIGPTRLGTGRVVRTVLAGATDLGAPTWTATGRLWVVDRTPNGARVYSRREVEARMREVAVPGVSGRRVRSILASPDGTRLVAIVDDRRSSRVVVARVALDAAGDVTNVLPARTILRAPRVREVGWFGDSRLGVLVPRPTGGTTVETIGIDGSPTGSTGLLASVTDIRRIIGSTDARQPFYALTPRGLIDLTRTGGDAPIGVDGATDLGYGG